MAGVVGPGPAESPPPSGSSCAAARPHRCMGMRITVTTREHRRGSPAGVQGSATLPSGRHHSDGTAGPTKALAGDSEVALATRSRRGGPGDAGRQHGAPDPDPPCQTTAKPLPPAPGQAPCPRCMRASARPAASVDRHPCQPCLPRRALRY